MRLERRLVLWSCGGDLFEQVLQQKLQRHWQLLVLTTAREAQVKEVGVIQFYLCYKLVLMYIFQSYFKVAYSAGPSL